MPGHDHSRFFRLARNVCHTTLAGTLLVLLHQLATIGPPSSDQRPSTTIVHQPVAADASDHLHSFAAVPALVAPGASAADWTVLAQTTLLGLVLVRLGDIVVGEGPRALLFRGVVGTWGVKEGERFLGACAAGVWGTRHLMLLLLAKLYPSDELARHDVTVLRASVIVAIVCLVMTVLHVVHNDEDDYDQHIADADIEAQQAGVDSKADSVPFELPDPSPSPRQKLATSNAVFQRVLLGAALVAGSLVLCATVHHGYRPSTPILVPIALSIPLFLFSHHLSTPHFSLVATIALLAWFYTAQWFTLVAEGGASTGLCPRIISCAARVVIVGLSLQLGDVYLWLGASDDRSLAVKVCQSVEVVRAYSLDAWLRVSPFGRRVQV